jgi:hypothetical protein
VNISHDESSGNDDGVTGEERQQHMERRVNKKAVLQHSRPLATMVKAT